MSQPAKQIQANYTAIATEHGTQSTQGVYKLTTAQRIYLPFKRLFDIVFSLLALIVLSPVFLIVAIIIKLESPGPVLFKQKRAGRNGVPFTVYKFRSMQKDAESNLLHMDAYLNYASAKNIKQRLKNDPRVTRFGKFIRKSSIDEFPQFFNVLIGNMSMVGPRPLILMEHEALDDYQKQRVLVKQGLTCIWQVSGRSLLDENTRVEMDIRYIKKFGFFMDFFLVLRTIPAVLAGIGAE